MQYLVLLYTIYNDGKDTRKAIYVYDTADEAIANFHQQVGNAMKDATVKHVMCMALNTNCGVYQECTWDRPEVKKDEQAEE